ncbi:MAG: phosphoribosyl-ATP diphosphatase [Candidatus Diapherotrites archaeon]
MLIPSIDIMNGKAVQLVQGKSKKLENKGVMKLANYFSRFGEIAIVDLDAVFGKGNNEKLVERLCRKFDCRVGGGIRSVEKAKRVLGYGAKKIIIGTNANREFLKKLPKNRAIVALDSKGGKVSVDGWKRKTKFTAEEQIKKLKNCCSGFLYTEIRKEGMMKGAAMDRALALRKIIPARMEFTYAGGITTPDEVAELNMNNINAQIGMSVYTGKMKLEDAFIRCLKFSNGLIPTIATNSNQVLMMAYSSQESIKKSLSSGKGIYYSRSRKKLWQKGETSGNSQKLVSARFDCDRDVLLYNVSQKNFACHSGSYSCFGDENFSLEKLQNVLEGRKNSGENSYTKKLIINKDLLARKLNEECLELIQARGKSEAVWELADLIYFISVYMVKNGIAWKDVLNELSLRRRT